MRLADALDALADPDHETVHEEVHEERDVLGAIAERREMDGEDVESVVEILAEGLFLDRFQQVAVGGGDDADIDPDRRLAADAVEFMLLQDVEQLGLDLGREFADLIEEDGAAVGELEAADAPGDGAREGPLLVAEELALHEPVGRALQLTLMNGLSARLLVEWMARAISSFPVPVSPVMSTEASVGATRRTSSSTADSAGLLPMIASKLWVALISS